MSSIISELPSKQWPKLRDLYRLHRNEVSSYALLKCFNNWINRNDSPAFSLKIYVLQDKWQHDGTFVALLNFGEDSAAHPTHLYCNTLSADLSSLKIALKIVVNYRQDYLLWDFSERVLPAVQGLFDYLCINDYELEEFHLFCLSGSSATHLRVDSLPDISLRPVDLESASQINQIWPHRSSGSECFIRHLINYNLSVGAYDRNGRLLGWCLQLPIGALGVLQVEESYRGRGLGSLLVRAQSRQLVAHDFEVMATVLPNNQASRGLMRKLGFKVQSQKVYRTKIPATGTIICKI